MGWPLFFQGNNITCDEKYLNKNDHCNLKIACKNQDEAEIEIKGQNTLLKEFSLICEKSKDLIIQFKILLYLLVVVFTSCL